MKPITLFFLLLFCNAISGQKYDYRWLNGSINLYNNTSNFFINFNHYPPKISNSNTSLEFLRTNIFISDINGNPLFSSNGCNFYKFEEDTTYLISDNINQNDYFCNSEGNLALFSGIFSVPGFNSNEYYTFSYSMWVNGVTNGDCIINHFIYHKLNVSAEQGAGEVLEQDSILAEGCFQHAAANRHANGRDWWIILPDNHEPKFYRWLLSPAGLTGPDTQYISNPAVDGNFFQGWNEFSPDGKKLLCRDYHIGTVIFDFDRCTGLLAAPYLIPSETAYNFASTFSFDNNFIYTVDSFSMKMFQYDLTAPDIKSTKTLVGSWDKNTDSIGTRTLFSYLQHGPDGKIYIWAGDTYFMHVINFPNRKGLACGVKQRAIQLPQRVFAANAYYPHYRLGPIDNSNCDTLGIDNIPMAMYHYDFEDTLSPFSVTFTDASYYEPTTWHWTFGDGSSSDEVSPVHAYSSPGTYTACLVVSNQYGADTLCRQVQIDTVSNVFSLPALPQVRVSPNPFREILQVALPALVPGVVPEFRLVDILGRTVCTSRLPNFNNELMVHNLPAGIYVWQVIWKGKIMQTGKVIK